MFVNAFSTLIDFDPYPSLIAFLPGCNLRCPYCYNRDLVIGCAEANITPAMIIELLDYGYFEGFVVSGGEPLCNQTDELIELLYAVKRKGIKIKIDTNLTIPIRKELLDCIDAISFTIKPISYYTDKYLLDNIIKNIDVANNLPYKELRITTLNEKGLSDSVALINDYLSDDWKILVHNAINVTTLSNIADKVFYSKDEFDEFINTNILPFINKYDIEVRYV